VFVIDAKIGNMVNVLPLVNPLRCPREDFLHPFVPCFCPLISIMFEQSRCSTSQFVPLQVENNLKGVKQQILDYDFELLIDIEKEASMSKVVQQVSFVGL
jgi:hypothetical protein